MSNVSILSNKPGAPRPRHRSVPGMWFQYHLLNNVFENPKESYITENLTLKLYTLDANYVKFWEEIDNILCGLEGSLSIKKSLTLFQI